MNTLATGAAAGLFATAPMSAAMLLLHRTAPDAATRCSPLPPGSITENAAAAADLDDELGEEGLTVATVAGHVAYGAAAGALLGPIVRRAPRPVATGAAFGVALWAVGYLGWVPAFGLMPPATEQPAGRNALMIASHIVWGATAGLLVAGWSDRDARRTR